MTLPSPKGSITDGDSPGGFTMYPLNGCTVVCDRCGSLIMKPFPKVGGLLVGEGSSHGEQRAQCRKDRKLSVDGSSEHLLKQELGRPNRLRQKRSDCLEDFSRHSPADGNRCRSAGWRIQATPHLRGLPSDGPDPVARPCIARGPFRILR
jgi:hypothetical protein